MSATSRASLDARLALAATNDGVQLEAIFGTRDDRAIAEALAGVTGPIDACTFDFVSVGLTLGLRLDDGRDVVLKAAVRGTLDRGAIEVQADLASRGYPAPAVLAGPTSCLRADVYVMAVADRGQQVVYDDTIRDAMACWYADLLSRMRTLNPPHAVAQHELPARLWPTPHSAIFDLDATARGAEHIDAIATAARDRIDATASPRQITHLDWALQNVAIRDGELVAVFDWDSVSVASEPLAVAGAAAFHLQDWFRGPEAYTHDFYAGVDWTLDFRDTYLAASGRTWSPAEHELFEANLLYRLAYQARCGHALDPAAPNPAAERLLAFARDLG